GRLPAERHWPRSDRRWLKAEGTTRPEGRPRPSRGKTRRAIGEASSFSVRNVAGLGLGHLTFPTRPDPGRLGKTRARRPARAESDDSTEECPNDAEPTGPGPGGGSGKKKCLRTIFFLTLLPPED